MAGQHSRMYKPRNRKPHEPGSATPPSPHNATLFRARRASGGVVSRWDAWFAILFGQSDASLCAAKQRHKEQRRSSPSRRSGCVPRGARGTHDLAFGTRQCQTSLQSPRCLCPPPCPLRSSHRKAETKPMSEDFSNARGLIAGLVFYCSCCAKPRANSRLRHTRLSPPERRRKISCSATIINDRESRRGMQSRVWQCVDIGLDLFGAAAEAPSKRQRAEEYMHRDAFKSGSEHKAYATPMHSRS